MTTTKENQTMKKIILAVAIAAATIGASASSAQAGGGNHAPKYHLETSHTVACGSATITLRNVSPWIYPTSVKIDGVHSYGPAVDNRGDAPDDQTKTRTISFDEDSGTHTVEYRVDAGSEADLYKNLPVGAWTQFTVESDCQPPVTTTPPTTTTEPPPTTTEPPATTTEPPVTTVPTTEAPTTTAPPIDGPATGPSNPDHPDVCIQHDTGGPDLDPGDYVIFDSRAEAGATGTTYWHIMPCGPIPSPVSTTYTDPSTPQPTATLPSTGLDGTGTQAAIALGALLAGTAITLGARRRAA